MDREYLVMLFLPTFFTLVTVIIFLPFGLVGGKSVDIETMKIDTGYLNGLLTVSSILYVFWGVLLAMPSTNWREKAYRELCVRALFIGSPFLFASAILMEWAAIGVAFSSIMLLIVLTYSFSFSFTLWAMFLYELNNYHRQDDDRHMT